MRSQESVEEVQAVDTGLDELMEVHRLIFRVKLSKTVGDRLKRVGELGHRLELGEEVSSLSGVGGARRVGAFGLAELAVGAAGSGGAVVGHHEDGIARQLAKHLLGASELGLGELIYEFRDVVGRLNKEVVEGGGGFGV